MFRTLQNYFCVGLARYIGLIINVCKFSARACYKVHQAWYKLIFREANRIGETQLINLESQKYRIRIFL